MKTILSILLIAITFQLQAQFSLNGEYRPRTELMHGQKTLMTKQNQMFSIATTQRARLGFAYKAEKFKVGLQIQDVRAWGAEGQLVINDGKYTTIHQAWGELLLNENLSLKLGRQELVYDDHRILGSVDWAQQARSHDLALLKYEKKDAFKFHFGVAVNQVQTLPYAVVGNYKSMQFAWFQKNFGDYNLSILALNNGVDDTTLNNKTGGAMTTYYQIVGQRSTYKKGKFSLGLNLYYQLGNDKSTYYDKVEKANFHRGFSAYNARLELGYKVTENISLEAGYEMISGQSQTDTTADYRNTNHAFNPAYGTNHKFNGWMDYFYVGNHLNTVGLNDMFFTVKYKKNKLLVGSTLHFFSAAADVLDVKEFATTGKIMAMDKNLGMELDSWASYKFTDVITIEGGVSGMFDSETLRTIKGGSLGASNYWVWMQVAFKPIYIK
ncbi:MAG: alginate export family protein [Bacteroidales bacterium]|nr:alginate export family protein [Bacteroidales bacterium]